MHSDGITFSGCLLSALICLFPCSFYYLHNSTFGKADKYPTIKSKIIKLNSVLINKQLVDLA